EVAPLVALRAVGEADVVAVARGRARGVLTRDDPRREVPLRERGARRPVRVLADRRAEREIRGAVREIVAAEQLLRRIEGARRQQVHLTEERRAREEVGRQARRGLRRAAEQARRAE